MALDPLTILVIDDDADFAETLSKALTSEGYRVVIAHSGIAGEALARTHSPNIVLLELILPDAHGYEIARSLRTFIAPTTAIVVLTGTNVGELAPADSAGIDLVLTKPVHIELLGGLLRFIHNKRKQRKL